MVVPAFNVKGEDCIANTHPGSNRNYGGEEYCKIGELECDDSVEIF